LTAETKARLLQKGHEDLALDTLAEVVPGRIRRRKIES
jgi:hypothetical protein